MFLISLCFKTNAIRFQTSISTWKYVQTVYILLHQKIVKWFSLSWKLHFHSIQNVEKSYYPNEQYALKVPFIVVIYLNPLTEINGKCIFFFLQIFFMQGKLKRENLLKAYCTTTAL